MEWLLLIPAYLAIGLGVVGGAIWTLPGDTRPRGAEAVSCYLVGMVAWPLLLWVWIGEGRGE